MFNQLPHSVLQMSTIFLSIIIEALPFVLLGCVISGAIHVLLTPERVKKLLPKNRLLSIMTGCILGFFFPSCECGIVPIVHQFVKKEVPVYTAFAFMLTAPIINPIVLFSTYIAFSNSLRYVFLRVGGSLVTALIIGCWLAYVQKDSVLKERLTEEADHKADDEIDQAVHYHHSQHHLHEHSHEFHGNGVKKIGDILLHGIDEFFDTGRYLIIGSLIASGMQVYLPTAALLTLGSTKILAILVMLILAFTMSLCSEADAFIGSSLLSLFGTAPVVAFLVYGPMIDIKNLLMMKRYFSTSFMVKFVLLCTSIVLVYAWLV